MVSRLTGVYSTTCNGTSSLRGPTGFRLGSAFEMTYSHVLCEIQASQLHRAVVRLVRTGFGNH